MAYCKKTTCSKCGKPKEESRLREGYCKACHNARNKAERPKYKDLKPEVKRKEIVRSYARSYVKQGYLRKQPCEVCGSENNIEMHHEDYSKPLLVKWLCRKHHMEIHKVVKSGYDTGYNTRKLERLKNIKDSFAE